MMRKYESVLVLVLYSCEHHAQTAWACALLVLAAAGLSSCSAGKQGGEGRERERENELVLHKSGAIGVAEQQYDQF